MVGIMAFIKVNHFVYTKLPKEESPWGKTDFHTVFYPKDLLSKNDLYELESRIHFPLINDFSNKKTVFYYNINGKYYLVVLYIKNLPEEKDTFGRGGIFLCHGFIFPPELWVKFPEPLLIFKVVEKYIFTNRTEIMSSQFIERNSGNMKPIEIKKEIVDACNYNLSEIQSNLELKIIMLLNKMARKLNDFPRIIIKGDSEKINTFMNKCISFLPIELRVNIGWDSCFDGGNFNFYPIKIVGYKENLPVGGGEKLIINLDEEVILNENVNKAFLLPENSFEKWLIHCYKEANNFLSIQKAYNLSLLLENKTFECNEVLEHRDCFISANEEKIKEVFFIKLRGLIGQGFTTYLLKTLSTKELLNIIITKLSLEKISKYIEDVIMRYYVTPKEVGSLPQAIKSQTVFLNLIDKLWNGKIITNNELNLFDKNIKERLIRYLILTDFKYKKWVLDILCENKDLLTEFLKEPKTKSNIDNIIFKIISEEKTFKGIEDIILKEIFRKGKLIDFLSKKLDLMKIIDEYIEKAEWNEKEINKLLKWKQGIKLPNIKYKYIRAYLFPKDGIPDDFIKDKYLFERLKEFLITYHGFKPMDFEKSDYKYSKDIKSLIEKFFTKKKEG